MFKRAWESLNVTELDNEKDTVASAFLKGATVTYVKSALVCGLVHLGIKGYRHFSNKNTSEEKGE